MKRTYKVSPEEAMQTVIDDLKRVLPWHYGEERSALQTIINDLEYAIKLEQKEKANG